MSAMVLIVGNDKTKTTDLANYLKKDFGVICAHSGRQAILQAKSHHLDAMIVDATSTRLNHRAICRKLRGTSSAPLILIVSPNAKLDSSLASASVLHAPVAAKRLLVRIKSAIESKPPRLLTVGPVSLDLEKRRVSRGARTSTLTPKEFCLLKLLMGRPGQTISRKTLMKEIWETDYLGDTRTLDVHVRWVREKVEDNPSKPRRLITMRGQGYRFME